MDIKGSSNAVMPPAPNDDPLSLKKANKAYHDERVTGLTDEEKAEIDRQARDYLKNHPIKSDQDRSAFNEFIKSLIKKFGFKGDIDEMAAGIASVTVEKSKSADETTVQTDVSQHYQKATMGAMSVRNKFLG